MTTVYDASSALAGTDDGNGNGGDTIRLVYPANFLTAVSGGNQVQVTFLWGTSETTETGALAEAWFGPISGAGADFDGTQQQLLFGGSASHNGSAAGVFTSDLLTLAANFDATKAYGISFFFKSGVNAACSQVFYPSGVHAALYLQFGANSAGTTSGASLSLFGLYDFYIEKIDVTVSGGGTTVSGAGSSAGVGTATGAGFGSTSLVAASGGVGAAHAVGAALFSGVAASSGVGTVSGVGAPLFSGVGSSAGVATVTGVAPTPVNAVGASTGIGFATAIGASLAPGVGSSAGLGDAEGVGSSITGAQGVGASAGVGTASGVGLALAAAAGASSGTGAATGVSTLLFSGVAASNGTGAANGVGVSFAASVAASAGLGTAAGVGVSNTTAWQMVGSSAGVGTATAVGASVAASVGNSFGSCTVVGFSPITKVVMYSPHAIVSGMPRQVLAPSGKMYQISPQGGVMSDSTDVAWFQTQGFAPIVADQTVVLTPFQDARVPVILSTLRRQGQLLWRVLRYLSGRRAPSSVPHRDRAA